MGDFWVIVNQIGTSPSTFVLLPTEVKDLSHRGEKIGRISYWLQPRNYENESFRDAWHRIGNG